MRKSLRSQMTLTDALSTTCDNPDNLPNCLGEATIKTETGKKLCEFCRTYGILQAAGLEPSVVF